jgi:hypothetical protein
MGMLAVVAGFMVVFRGREKKTDIRGMEKLIEPGDIPKGLSQPALRAMKLAGINSLNKLSTFREMDFAALHGVGPKAVNLLRSAMADKGLRFKDHAER